MYLHKQFSILLAPEFPKFWVCPDWSRSHCTGCTVCAEMEVSDIRSRQFGINGRLQNHKWPWAAWLCLGKHTVIELGDIRNFVDVTVWQVIRSPTVGT